jgi:hypothetical protein
MTKPTAPAQLGAKAAKLWRGLVNAYELRPDELRILEDACREIDLVERMEVELADAELVVPGSTRQPTAHPLVEEVRLHRALTARLLNALRLPDDAADRAPLHRSVRARDAANQRWRRGS